MVQHGYRRSKADHFVYTKKSSKGKFIIPCLYVHDILIIGKDMHMIDRLKQDLSKSFAMKDLGPAEQILETQISQDRETRKLWLSQGSTLRKYWTGSALKNAKPVGTPLAGHFELSSTQSPSNEKEKKEMLTTHYASAVGCMIYIYIYICYDTY